MSGNSTTNGPSITTYRWSDIGDPQQLCNTLREVASGGSAPNENQRQQLSQAAFMIDNLLQQSSVRDYISQQGVKSAGAGGTGTNASNGGTSTVANTGSSSYGGTTQGNST